MSANATMRATSEYIASPPNGSLVFAVSFSFPCSRASCSSWPNVHGLHDIFHRLSGSLPGRCEALPDGPNCFNFLCVGFALCDALLFFEFFFFWLFLLQPFSPSPGKRLYTDPNRRSPHSTDRTATGPPSCGAGGVSLDGHIRPRTYISDCGCGQL